MRTQHAVSTPTFVVDPNTEERSSGRQIDWPNVPASFAGDSGKKTIPAGTAMHEQADGTLIPRSATEAAAHLMVSHASEISPASARTGYGTFVGGRFYEDLLPDASGADMAAIKTELGAAFRFETYQNSAAAA